MGLEILKPESETMSWVTATQRLWLTADGEQLVVDGDPAAATLFCAPGQRIPLADAVKYGLAQGKTEKLEAVDQADDPEKLEAPDKAETDELEGLSVKELRAIADERGVDITGLKKKADILAALEAVDQADDPELAVEDPQV